jgi:hypothetical protein
MAPTSSPPCRELRLSFLRSAIRSVEAASALGSTSGWAQARPVSMTAMVTPRPV